MRQPHRARHRSRDGRFEGVVLSRAAFATGTVDRSEKRQIALGKTFNLIGWGASYAALFAALLVLVLVFGFVFLHGLPALKPSLFTTVTSGTAGGLANAITGTLLLVLCGTVLTIFVGIGTGIWLAEYSRGFAASALRFLSDILAGVPSIVIGYFGYAVLVQRFGWHFSLAAGALALALIMMPYVVRGTDTSLCAVPSSLVEGSYALGATRVQTFSLVTFPHALPGIMTSMLLASGIALGETAPLIYTAGWSNFMPSLAPTHSPVGYLTYVVWTFISQPFEESHQLAYAAAALLMIFIFLTNVVSRLALASYAKRTQGN